MVGSTCLKFPRLRRTGRALKERDRLLHESHRDATLALEPVAIALGTQRPCHGRRVVEPFRDRYRSISCPYSCPHVDSEQARTASAMASTDSACINAWCRSRYARRLSADSRLLRSSSAGSRAGELPEGALIGNLSPARCAANVPDSASG